MMTLTHPIPFPGFGALVRLAFPGGRVTPRLCVESNPDGTDDEGILPFYHQSILLDEVVEALVPGPGKLIADGTLGGGGHTEAFLRAGATVKGIDRDPEARVHASQRLASFGNRFEAVAGCFSEMSELARQGNWGGLDGILLDLGVSSHQLDEGGRGFSFRQDGPLDMRMGNTVVTAADLVNGLDEARLRQLFWDLGEERSSRKIAAWIVAARARQPFKTTLQLADGIASLLGRRGRTHPATKVFQALRMEVNDELGELHRFLNEAPGLLKPGGRLAIITFHSLEDRMVKQAFREASLAQLDRPEWPAPRPNPARVYRLLTRKGVAPSAEEIARNPRSRSSRLRVVERLESLSAP